MDQIIADYLSKFEDKVRRELLSFATGENELSGKLLESEDINGFWHKIEANYMADAVPEITAYPTVSVGWALYLGMAVAYNWDNDWEKHCNAEYETYYGDQGFDNMDDHIVRDILGMPLDSSDAKKTVNLVQSLAQKAVDIIRHENIEPQSKMAFYVFARVCDAMFSIGAAVELHRLGYKFEKMN